MGETQKSHDRRVREGWYEKYISNPGIDLGCQHDPISPDFKKWDVIFGDGDATFMEGVPDESYKTVYASHLVEHLDAPVEAIKNWFRILKKDGYLIILAPSKDLYEKKDLPPSHWNAEHKTFWMPENHVNDKVRGLKQTVLDAIPNANIVSFRTLNEGFVSNGPLKHSSGEYSIEIIIKK